MISPFTVAFHIFIFAIDYTCSQKHHIYERKSAEIDRSSLGQFHKHSNYLLTFEIYRPAVPRINYKMKISRE